MNIEELQSTSVKFFDISENELFPFSKTWKKTFEAIEESLKELNDEIEKERILQKVLNIVNFLVRYGTTYEDIVLETAELYIFSREAKIDPIFFEKSYGESIVDSVICLNNDLVLTNESTFTVSSVGYISNITLTISCTADGVLTISSSTDTGYSDFTKLTISKIEVFK